MTSIDPIKGLIRGNRHNSSESAMTKTFALEKVLDREILGEPALHWPSVCLSNQMVSR
jgi:hypothetical protein